MKNPHTNPLEGRTGNTAELLASLSSEEIKKYIAYYLWRQANETFPEKPKNAYQSQAYFKYRTDQFIYNANQRLDVIDAPE